MKFYLIIIIFICLTAIALINLSYYKKKIKIFSEVIKFLQFYINEINFNKLSVGSIINNYLNNFSQETKQLLKNYKSMSMYPNVLAENDKKLLYNIFYSLGNMDVESEVSKASSGIEVVKNLLNDSKEQFNVKGLLRSKLIFIFGLILIVVLI